MKLLLITVLMLLSHAVDHKLTFVNSGDEDICSGVLSLRNSVGCANPAETLKIAIFQVEGDEIVSPSAAGLLLHLECAGLNDVNSVAKVYKITELDATAPAANFDTEEEIVFEEGDITVSQFSFDDTTELEVEFNIDMKDCGTFCD